MKILFLNSYYETFLESHYAKNDIEELGYEEQLASVQGAFFGDSDFYSEGMKAHGWDAETVVTNCKPLQIRWAEENDYDGKVPIWVEQIWKYRPDVVYAQELWRIKEAIYPLIRKYCKIIAGQTGSKIDNFGSSIYNVIFTSVPQFVDQFRKAEVLSYYLPLAFDKRVWNAAKGHERIYPITFVGNVTAGHLRRKEVLEKLNEHFTVHEWIGELWGIDMFRVLAQSMITIHCNIDFSQPNVGGMRLYEGTGCGAAMVTDYGENLHALFTKKEICIYKNPDEAVVIVDNLLQNEKKRKAIAKAGQKRTFTDHSYIQRMEVVSEILKGML